MLSMVWSYKKTCFLSFCYFFNLILYLILYLVLQILLHVIVFFFHFAFVFYIGYVVPNFALTVLTSKFFPFSYRN